MHWLKAFHVIAVVAWFAGLFYLPRLFVYHVNTTDGPGKARFIVMEHKLYYYIMAPSAIIALLLGLLIAGLMWSTLYHAPWFYIKVSLVAVLVGFHLACGRWLKQFKLDQNHHSEQFYRITNEIPTLLLIGIVLLVYLKP